jgi:hypothetical protein
MTNLQKLRDLLLDLTYSEMMIFASKFADTEKDDSQPINDGSFWAFVINDWATHVELPEDEEQQP